MKAIFGLTEKPIVPQTDERYSESELATMRAILARHGNSHKPMKEFDLNKPPQVPYTHQEFPRMVYNHELRKHAVAQNQVQLDAALEAGWSKQPYPIDEPAGPELSAAEQAEVANLDREARKPKKK